MGKKQITSSHNVVIVTDALAEEIDYEQVDMIVLPGGLPGTTYLSESIFVRRACIEFSKDRFIAAICAAPSVLASLGLLDGKKATCHPSFRDKLGNAVVSEEEVVVTNNIITGRGLGAGIPFALKLIEILTDSDVARRIADSISFKGK